MLRSTSGFQGSKASSAASTEHDPKTPKVVCQTKALRPTEAECSSMTTMLNRMQYEGSVDLQSQLDLLSSSEFLHCSNGGGALFGTGSGSSTSAKPTQRP
jgi:hypothetical protein